MTVLCHSCNLSFVDYKELALHISTSRKGHRQGKKWAAKYMMKVRALDKRNNGGGRSPLTEDDKENKKNTRRELSGDNEHVATFCPHCRKKTKQVLPIEYTRSNEAWRLKDYLVVLCQNCEFTSGISQKG